MSELANLEAEQGLLAAVLGRWRDLPKVAYLSPEDFFDPTHRAVWRHVLAEFGAGGKPTAATLVARLKADPDIAGTATSGYLLRLCQTVAPINAEEYAKQIRDLACRREMRETFGALVEATQNFDATSDELVARAIGQLHEMTKRGPKAALTKREVAIEVVEALKEPPRRFSSGLPSLDRVIGGGLFSGKCYGIAARKKVGKTVLLGTMSHNMNRTGIKHLFIAGEMSPPELEQRNMARELRINSVEFLKGTAGYNLARRAADYAVNVPNSMLYEHAPGATLDDVRRMVTRAIVQHGIAGFFVDYWQLVQGKAKNETEELHLRNVAQWIADVCRKERVWAVIAAQVNQEGNTRGGEGLKLACDCYFTLHREKDQEGAWLEMEESRYVLYANVGSEMQPGLYLNKHGPFFEDAAPGVREPAIPAHDEDGVVAAE